MEFWQLINCLGAWQSKIEIYLSDYLAKKKKPLLIFRRPQAFPDFIQGLGAYPFERKISALGAIYSKWEVMNPV